VNFQNSKIYKNFKVLKERKKEREKCQITDQTHTRISIEYKTRKEKKKEKRRKRNDAKSETTTTMITKSRWTMAAGQRRRPFKALLFVLPLLVLWLSVLPDCVLAAKRSNMNPAGANHATGGVGGTASSNRPRAATTKTTTTTTTTTPSSITPDDWR
jgi:hypothetical protein